MKKTIAFLVLIASISFVYAGPFGLSNGMTLDEVTAACDGRVPEKIENDDRYFIQPAKSHSMFKTYVAWISKDYGLYYVRGISDSVQTNDYGEEIKNVFYPFENRLEKIYGIPILVDEATDPTSLWKDDKYWLYALRQGARQLYAEWHTGSEYVTMKYDLYFVRLWVTDSDYNKTQLLIDYGFINHEKVQNQEDDVL